MTIVDSGLQLTPHASLRRAHLRNAWIIKDSGHFWCPVCGSCIDAGVEAGTSTSSPSEAGGEQRSLLDNTSLQRGDRSGAEAISVTMGAFVVRQHGCFYCPLCSRDISERMPTTRAESQPSSSSAAPMQLGSQGEEDTLPADAAEAAAKAAAETATLEYAHFEPHLDTKGLPEDLGDSQPNARGELLRELTEASDRTIKRARTVYAAASPAAYIHDSDSQETDPGAQGSHGSSGGPAFYRPCLCVQCGCVFPTYLGQLCDFCQIPLCSLGCSAVHMRTCRRGALEDTSAAGTLEDTVLT